MAPKTLPAIASIESDKRIIDGREDLRKLNAGFAETKNKIDSLSIETHLGARAQPVPRAADKAKRPAVTRDDLLRDRLAKNRAQAAPAKKVAQPSSGERPYAVARALEIIENPAAAPPALDNRALLKQLKSDLDEISVGIAAQTRIVNGLMEELKHSQAIKDQGPWFELQLRKFRAYQAAIAIHEEENEFMKSRFAEGFMPWRGDLLPELACRVKLVLGTERTDDYNSEISRLRRALEEHGKLKP